MGIQQSAEDVKIKESFDGLRKTLTEERFQTRLTRPLAYWVQTADRRLPLTFLDRTVGDIISSGFYDLSRTSGVGPKKMTALVKLLRRVSLHDVAPPEAVVMTVDQNSACAEHFNPDQISEVVWQQWRKTVQDFGLEGERLGRVAPSLSRLPSVIWKTPLRFYLDHSLEEIRSLKTYGRKRVTVVMEVFHELHRVLAGGRMSECFDVRFVPRFVRKVETWLAAVRDDERIPERAEIMSELFEPILKQLHNDAGETVVHLVRCRLGIGSPVTSVRQQSRSLGVTRARIYQMLDECHDVFAVRWPEGRCLLHELQEHLVAQDASPDLPALLADARDVFYPRKFENVAKHLIVSA